ncbi:MAG: penicillin-binding protein 2 [Actinobacteria bacterium]|nr:penicillin-binding protein 2 [Actinomycetota bacterium]
MVFRIGILGFLVLVAFAILFFRLWALQVLSGTQHLQAAENNQLRTLRIEAARGPIRDWRGRVLVDNAGATAIRVYPSDLPDKGAYAELKRLAQILRVPLVDITKQIEQYQGDPVTPVTVKEDATEAEVQFLTERNAEFPGVVVEDTYVRRYPFGDLAPQLLGHVGEISPEQLAEQRSYRSGDRIGQGGVESAFDKFLRGQTGLARLRVDSLGRPTSAALRDTDPIPGHGLRLTLDAKLQRAAQAALVYGIDLALDEGNWNANAGAIVALDPRDGAIRAMASHPTFHPEVYVKPGQRKQLQLLLDQEAAAKANYPSLNRVTSGLYPPGSTFKPVTALAGMQEHILAPYDAIPCTGEVTIFKQRFRNWNPFVNEAMTLPTALAQSCDTYFYEVGKRFYDLPPERGHPLQEWANRFGFGQLTGLDVGPELAGLLPTPEWRKATYTKKTDPCCWEIDRLWKPGDSVQLAIGQKDLQVTPLQMARMYALIANGGKLVTPHVVAAVQQGNARGGPTGPLTLRRFSPPPREIAIDKEALEVVREGLYQATHAADGTSAGTFGHFPVPIAGKTGTAERLINFTDYSTLMDTSWWCGYGPSHAAELVVCALIENGGFGGEAAAPAALKVFESYFGEQAGLVQPAEAD